MTTKKISVSSRLPSVQSLSSILPAGTEGGKEFARIVGLLLFYDAKKLGYEFNLFNDAAGDYEGLDSFSRLPKAKEVTGFQYKFFASPLTNDHRQIVKNSIDHALARSKRLKLTKWVLVTPDDFSNSGRRKEGGDVAWFDGLRDAYQDRIEIEHIGHSKLLALFLQNPHLSLFYYPSLVPAAQIRKKSIQELRTQYDDNMRRRYGRIEFVGMSVYKEEASRRIPLENIYIPLSVVAERAPEETDATPRIDPLSFLKPGAKTVVLGDPGSGKSTLLAFLALAGISTSLQNRCNLSADGRLTIFVTLRRYADELKSRKNLPLLEYIIEVAKADFNISGLDQNFYEFYLETGQAIVLFDGLDELPGPQFKSTIRQRIESFTMSYPSNTIVVTSRLVGYEAEVRFDDLYGHFRVAKLRVDEIRQFIIDWYAARIEDEIEKKRNAEDLVRVITHVDSESIRTLARNPLLLTIVALVHRIDAVLPDQRVVLYQKCTETLLNTWYKAKRRDEETVKGRVERRNRLRIEAIAYWMHKRSLEAQGRSVAPRAELLKFLTSYIETSEKLQDSDDEPEDQAEIFLEFIKTSAGLLVEAGDELYSFIHLTFQEYLCATHLAAFGETGGTEAIWNELHGDLQNPRWREVVRLLVASLRSLAGQAFFVDKLIENIGKKDGRDTVLLLIGLLRDAIEPAEINAETIVAIAIEILQSTTDLNDIRLIQNAMRGWITKNEKNLHSASEVWEELFASANGETALVLLLIRMAIGLPTLSDADCSRLVEKIEQPQLDVIRSLVLERSGEALGNAVQTFSYFNTIWALTDPDSNAAAASGVAVSALMDRKKVGRQLFLRELSLLAVNEGPHQDHGLNLVALALSASDMHPSLLHALDHALELRVGRTSEKRRKLHQEHNITEAFMRLISVPVDDSVHHRSLTAQRAIDKGLKKILRKQGILVGDLRKKEEEKNKENSDFLPELMFIRRNFLLQRESDPGLYWDLIRSSEIFDRLIYSLTVCLKITPSGHWHEALMVTLAKSVPRVLGTYFDQQAWRELAARLQSKHVEDHDADFAAWLILFDIWIWINKGYELLVDSPLQPIIDAAQQLGHPTVQLALSIRNISLRVKGALPAFNALIYLQDNGVAELLKEAGWQLRDDSVSSKRRVSKISE